MILLVNFEFTCTFYKSVSLPTQGKIRSYYKKEKQGRRAIGRHVKNVKEIYIPLIARC